MAGRAFRFVHSSDWHLDRPMAGVADALDALREILIEAPYHAARRVCDLAIEREVDFLLLSGNVIDVQHAGPRGLAFVEEQFSRLGEHGISVYWAAGEADAPDRWPAEFRLPAHVRRFSQPSPECVTHCRAEEPLLQILGAAGTPRHRVNPAEFHPSTDDVAAVAVTCGAIAAGELAQSPVAYWALGGEPQRRAVTPAPRMASYCGSPQGRAPDESGVYGCMLVEVSKDNPSPSEGEAATAARPRRGGERSEPGEGEGLHSSVLLPLTPSPSPARGEGRHMITATFIPTDVIRWHDENIHVGDAVTAEELTRRLLERAAALRDALPGITLLVRWTVTGSKSLALKLRQGTLATGILEPLRRDFGRRTPALWSASLAGGAPPALESAVPADWFAEETLLGEFLRAARKRASSGEPLDLSEYVAQADRALLPMAARLSDRQSRDRAISQAALVGIDLLHGEGSRT